MLPPQVQSKAAPQENAPSERSRLVRKLALGFGVAAVVILLVSVAALQSIREYQEAAKKVEHTLQVLRTIEALEAEIGNSEANRRGYALTNRAEFLEGCRKAMASAEQELGALRELIADNPPQQGRVAEVTPLLAQRLASLRRALEEQQSGRVPVEKQVTVINESLQITPQIRAKLEEMRGAEMELLKQRNAHANASAQRTTWMIFLTAVLAVAFFVPAGWSIRNEFLARQRAEEKLEAANRELAAANEAVTRELQKSQQLSAELQQQTAMLSLVLENMAEGLVMADPAGHFLVYNRAAERILGVPGKDLPPSEWPKYYSAYLPDGSAPFPVEQIPLVRAIGGESCDGVEMQIRRPGEESPIWILLNGRPVLDAGGKLIGGVVVFRDITAQRQAQQKIRDLNQQLERRAEELEQAVKELETFSYSVSHDLRAPLRHMAGFTRILLEDYGSQMDAEQRRLFDRVAEGARQMGQLIDDLLDFSRVSRRPLNAQWTGLSSLLEDARKTLEPELEGRNIEWRIGELPFVECDPALLRQVFQNLLANAVKFTRPRDPAVIEVGVEPSNGRPAVYVRDNGVGFSMKYAEKLFGVFQRLHRQEDFEGTGVGLATVQRIVRRHGGDVWAASEPNRGATFYFTLPGLQPAAAAPEPREEKFST